MAGHRRLPRSTPHEQGVSGRRIAEFLDAMESPDAPEIHSLMVLRHGTVVAEGWREPYRPDVVHEAFSLTKAFTSTAVGFARAEGLLDLDDLVLDHLRDLAPAEPSANLQRQRIRHLLTMTSGHAEGVHDGLFELPDWERAVLALPVPYEPGTRFVYSSAATYLLAVILHRRTGLGLAEYLRPRLLEPLGIDGWRWDRSPSGLENGGFGLSVTTEDIACLGQLYLDGGRWQGRQLLPAGWAEEATALQVPSVLGEIDWEQGYGYAFWRCRHGAVRGDGAFGQFSILFPEHDAVVAITGGTPDLQGVLDRVWAHLLPAVAGDPADPAGELAAERDLAHRLATWRFDPPQGSTPPALDLSGRTVAFPSGEVTVVATHPSGVPAQVELRLGDTVESLAVGDGTWEPGALDGPFAERRAVATAAAWQTPTDGVVQVRWPGGPACLTAHVTIDGAAVRVTAVLSVNFHGPTDLGSVTGALR